MTTFMANAQTKINITVNGKTLEATLESNISADEFKEMMPFTIQMSDYGNFEKVGALPQSITRNDTQMDAHPGDIMLYLGSNVSIFYGNNHWDYTKLGRIDDATAAEIKSFLNGNIVEATFSLKDDTGVNDILSDSDATLEVYELSGRKINLNGHSVSELPKGFYIINGKKTLIK